MQTLRDIAPYMALGAAVLSLVLVILAIVLFTRVSRLRRAQAVVLGHHEERDIIAHVEHLDSQVRNLREAVEILTDQLDGQKRQLDHALTNRAIVRYDAFRDAGGEQSASFALLDQYRSGVVFSAIAARDFARIYVKHITEGVADRDLSPEEAQAMEAAVPHPLKPGEEGQRAKRAPLPEMPPPFGLREITAADEDPRLSDEDPRLSAESPTGDAEELTLPGDAGTGRNENALAEAAGGRSEAPSRASNAVPPMAAAAFEALDEYVSDPGSERLDAAGNESRGDAGDESRGAAGHTALDADDEFRWEPPPERPESGGRSDR